MIKTLVVDDELDVTQLYLQKFRKEIKNGELKFDFAHNGQQALEYIRTLKPFDLVVVLSDINMPQMTGLELLQAIKKERPTLNVIMISAYGDMTNKSKAVEYGASDFLTKPVDFTALKEKIMKAHNEINN